MDWNRARPSRRVVVGMCAGAAALPYAVKAAAQTSPPPGGSDATLKARVDAASHLTLEVMVNHKGPYRFVIDTGAERSVIADSVAAELSLPAGPPLIVDGISGRTQSTSVRVERLSFGPFTRRNLNLPVLSRAHLDADGFLGLDAIDGTRVTFDFARKQVSIYEHREYLILPEDLSARIDASGKGGHLRFTDGRVDGVATTIFIDTGAEVSVGNPALYAALRQGPTTPTELGVALLTGVTGGQLPGVVIPVKRIQLQALRFTDGTLVIADPPDFAAWKLDTEPAMLIGLDYLRQFAAVTIDYRDKAVRFNLSAITPSPTPEVSLTRMG